MIRHGETSPGRLAIEASTSTLLRDLCDLGGELLAADWTSRLGIQDISKDIRTDVYVYI